MLITRGGNGGQETCAEKPCLVRLTHGPPCHFSTITPPLAQSPCLINSSQRRVVSLSKDIKPPGLVTSLILHSLVKAARSCKNVIEVVCVPTVNPVLCQFNFQARRSKRVEENFFLPYNFKYIQIIVLIFKILSFFRTCTTLLSTNRQLLIKN